MRIPLSWLRQYAPLPEQATAEDVLASLVTVGLEEEAVYRPADDISGPVVVGQVLSMQAETHSNGKTVNWCSVRVLAEGRQQSLSGPGIAEDGVQGIICGAHNFKVGDKVVVALPGACLPGGFKISVRKTYGHVSAGMIASARELGIGEDHQGILVLSSLGLDPELGSDALKLLGLDDQAAEVNVTPDRGYAFSIRGIAREYCHAQKVSFNDFVADWARKAPAANEQGYPVLLNDQAPIRGRQGCTRFATRQVSGLQPGAVTPTWMAARLRLAGIRSISLPVDISNYLMLETGQPLHFYDLDRIQGGIEVRRARAGETLLTLDGKERSLSEEDLLICDQSGPIGLAGLMGGASTECSGQTSNILIESARFDEVSVARSARRHKLSSEASKRFERGVDPKIQAAVAQRAVELLCQLGGATAQPAVTDIDDSQPSPTIELDRDYPAQRIGLDYEPQYIQQLLTQIGAELEPCQSGWLVSAPSWRPDIQAKEDLVEEIARLAGYDKIPSRLPQAPAGRGYSRDQLLNRRVLEALAVWGMTETLSYPFVSQEASRLWASPRADQPLESIKLANPISASEGWLRRSLLPGLVETLKRNLSRGFKDLAIFESGHVFIPSAEQSSFDLPEPLQLPSQQILDHIDSQLPQQPQFLAGLFTGYEHAPMPDSQARPYDWRDSLDALGLVADCAGVSLRIVQGQHQAFHPGRTAVVTTADGQQLGYAGELHPQLLQDQDMPERTCAFEINLSLLLAQATEVIRARPISSYPAATQDLALVVPEETPASQLAETLAEGAGDLLENIRVFDDYRGPGLDQGEKSLAFALRFRAADRTLTAEEASACRDKALALAAERFGARLRA